MINKILTSLFVIASVNAEDNSNINMIGEFNNNDVVVSDVSSDINKSSIRLSDVSDKDVMRDSNSSINLNDMFGSNIDFSEVENMIEDDNTQYSNIGSEIPNPNKKSGSMFSKFLSNTASFAWNALYYTGKYTAKAALFTGKYAAKALVFAGKCALDALVFSVTNDDCRNQLWKPIIVSNLTAVALSEGSMGKAARMGLRVFKPSLDNAINNNVRI
ncbi:MAG: hypothetical protein IJ848_00405 [Alphaproteobacteria bacterium]|nr:hypothetical protein [Alphaproteobacteria bacterium]